MFYREREKKASKLELGRPSYSPIGDLEFNAIKNSGREQGRDRFDPPVVNTGGIGIVLKVGL